MLSKWVKTIGLLFMCFSFILSACQSPSSETSPPAVESSQPEQTLTLPDMPAFVPLPSTPIAQTFQTSDEVELKGKFYPSAMIDEPLIVLMHWALGDQEDWRVVAPWLQNRDFQRDQAADGSPWLDASWFPELREDLSFNVFTFTFRGCEGGCQDFNREGWLLDVEAAVNHIMGFENVDLSQVIMLGASIGADGAAYGCHLYNSVHNGCQGAISLSPGGYLTIPYSAVVADLEAESPSKLAWCLYSSEDMPSADSCQSASGEFYQSFEYPGSAHGMVLIDPDLTPNPLDLILQFLEDHMACGQCTIDF